MIGSGIPIIQVEGRVPWIPPSISAQSVFDAADRIFDFALELIGLAFALKLAVAGQIPDHLFHLAVRLFGRAFDPILINPWSTPMPLLAPSAANRTTCAYQKR